MVWALTFNWHIVSVGSDWWLTVFLKRKMQTVIDMRRLQTETQVSKGNFYCSLCIHAPSQRSPPFANSSNQGNGEQQLYFTLSPHEFPIHHYELLIYHIEWLVLQRQFQEFMVGSAEQVNELERAFNCHVLIKPMFKIFISDMINLTVHIFILKIKGC